jgi:hypothetical protein
MRGASMVKFRPPATSLWNRKDKNIQPTDDEPPLVVSPLSQELTRHEVTVQVEIYGDEKGKWVLEVVDARNTSHIWDDHFDTDSQALAEAIRALEEEPTEFQPSAPGDVD